MDTDILVQNLQTGLTITFIGMAVVLLFLTLMIGVINVAGRLIQVLNKYFPEAQPQITAKKKTEKNDDEIALAIALAHDFQNR